MAPEGLPERPRSEVVPPALFGLGIAIGLVLVCEVVLFPVTGLRSFGDPSFVVGAVSTLPFLAGLLYAGRWLPRSKLSPDRYPRVALWTAACAVASLVLNLALILTIPAGSALEAFSWLRWAFTIGACVGVGIGIVEGRAIEHALDAERAELRSEHVARQRDTLDYLNGVLRHEILNAATVIDGYVSRVLAAQSDLDRECERWLEIAVDEAQEMERVIDDVRVLLHRTDGDDALEPVDLAEVLERELDSLTTRRPDVAVDASIPKAVEVLADDTLPRAFGNLLSNAVEHNDARDPSVSVDVERSPDVVRVTIADDGPGVPAEERDSLWEREHSDDDSHGLGLYLVGELVERFGGSVELAETGPGGSTFTVELQRASDRPDERDGRAEPPAPA